MIITTYVHGDRETIDDLCGENGLDSSVFFDPLMNILYEIELKIEVDMLSGTAKLIEVDGKKLI